MISQYYEKEITDMKKTLKLTAFIAAAAILLALLILVFANKPQAPGQIPDLAPGDEIFTFNFVGDNALDGAGFQATTGGRADYPYANTKKFLDGAEFNFANLECIISDAALYSDSLFHFKAPTRNTAMLTWAGIDFVTTANNHTLDYGQRGLDDTVAALEKAGISYGLDGKTSIYETRHGIKIGIYCGSQYVYEGIVVSSIAQLKEQKVDLIICAFHWGNEGAYRPTAMQTRLAHAAIDAGADIVYGSHPHVLQPVEEYKDGFIMYSLGNWSFGGNSRPADMDSAIIQVSVKRDLQGSLSIADYKLIPCRVSSISSYNDYCPTPYEEGTSEYDRTMSKLTGTFTGPDLVVDYSHLRPQESDSPQTTEVPEVPETPEETDAPVPEPTPETESSEYPVPELTE